MAKAASQTKDASGEADIQRALLAAKRMRAALIARDDLLAFARLLRPAPESPDDPERSQYVAGRHHILLARKLMAVEDGSCRRLVVTMPPRHGKSELSTRMLPAWFMGRRPQRQVIVGAYNAKKAASFGNDVLTIFKDPAFGQCFPEFALDPKKQNSEEIRTLSRGEMLFAGVDGSSVGYGADLLLIDDPFKNRQDADSAAHRQKVWSWFTNVSLTRLMPGAAIVIVLTRWHEDDLVGRILNAAYVPEELAAGWEIISLPALAEAGDPLGREPGQALWPEWYDEKYHAETRAILGRDFISLYQQRPAPEEGSYFRKDMLRAYAKTQLPTGLRYYGASDHALSVDPTRDASVLLIFGVDANDVIYLVDCFWGRVETEELSEKIIAFIKKYKPLEWFPANDNIFRSFKPFLDKRIREENAWCFFHPIQETRDLEARAQSIRGRMSQGMVRFPNWAPWYAEACAQILTFPSAKHDDFIAALSLIGLGMDRHLRAPPTGAAPADPAPIGSLRWIVETARRQALASTASERTGWML